MCSTNAYPFEAKKAYSRFAVYALLEHKGDYTAAAQELSKQGYGQQRVSESGSSNTSPYWVRDGVIGYDKPTRSGPVPICLTNFTTKIVGEVVRDDGVEIKTLFVIEGADRHGKSYHSIEVTTPQFSGLGWITTNWGNGPVVYAGQMIRDNLRCAIQLLSG
jgi:hypothetical protein